MIRVLIADDQALVREGFRLILEVESDIEVVGEASNGAQAVGQGIRLAPDVILMDIRMPEVDGIAAVRQLVEAGVSSRVLMLTTFDRDDYLFNAMRAGASGFLVKDVRREECTPFALSAPAIRCSRQGWSAGWSRTSVSDHWQTIGRRGTVPGRSWRCLGWACCWS